MRAWLRKTREVLGVIALDLGPYHRDLSATVADGKSGWVSLRNRQEELRPNPNGPGFLCDWRWTSALHACQVFPRLGSAVMVAALNQWPIELRAEGIGHVPPEISFIIPHRQVDRVPLLLATLESILAQDVPVECIVVEQGPRPELHNLPAEVKSIHLPHPEDPTGWYKSWAYNVGAAAARAPIVVCHDGDILVPSAYGRELLTRFSDRQCEVVFAQRFLFYLSSEHTAQVLAERRVAAAHPPERIVQNWKGGTLAIRRSTFFEIGGFDEAFEGWTGEDIEFHDRTLVRQGWHYGYLPFVHLWHPAQPDKVSSQRAANLAFTEQMMQIPREVRVAMLKRRQSWCHNPTHAAHPPPVRGVAGTVPRQWRP